MEFDKSKVFTAVNADELKVGSKVYVADSFGCLKRYVEKDTQTETLKKVEDDDFQYRFVIQDDSGYALAYLVEEPEEKKLKVSDLKLGDIVRHKSGNLEYLVAGIDHNENEVFFGDAWSDDEELGNWWEKVEK